MVLPFIRSVLVPSWILIFVLVVLGAPPLLVTASALLIGTAILVMSGLLLLSTPPVRASAPSRRRDARGAKVAYAGGRAGRRLGAAVQRFRMR